MCVCVCVCVCVCISHGSTVEEQDSEERGVSTCGSKRVTIKLSTRCTSYPGSWLTQYLPPLIMIRIISTVGFTLSMHTVPFPTPSRNMYSGCRNVKNTAAKDKRENRDQLSCQDRRM